MIDYSRLKQSLMLLESQYYHLQTLDDTLPEWLQEAVSESGKNHESPCYSWSAAPFMALSSRTIK